MVMLSIARDGLAYSDDLAHEWVAQAGEFEVLHARISSTTE